MATNNARNNNKCFKKINKIAVESEIYHFELWLRASTINQSRIKPGNNAHNDYQTQYAHKLQTKNHDNNSKTASYSTQFVNYYRNFGQKPKRQQRDIKLKVWISWRTFCQQIGMRGAWFNRGGCLYLYGKCRIHSSFCQAKMYVFIAFYM